MTFQTISNDNLEAVLGGSLGGKLYKKAEELYKRWTQDGQPTPKKVFDEAMSVGGKVGAAAGAAGVAAYEGAKHLFGGSGK
jgi:hypothetical protein